MTEQEWLACTDPEALWDYLFYNKASSRKLMLWACACLRRIWHLLTDERCRRAVELAERGEEEALPDHEYFPVYWAASDAWRTMAEAAADGQYSSPILRALPHAGGAAWHLIDGDWQCIGNAA